jgi:hypothetical protein
MPFNRSIFIETPRVSRENLADSLLALPGCWKCGSLLWMQSNGFPVLPGLILNGWVSETEAVVSRFCRERGFSEVLIRIEKPGQRWTRRRGGYTIPVGNVRSQVEELAREGMITILLEPASPYSDTFSLTSVCDLETGKVDLEVVGPGFDASDILRSDILPHERFEVFLGNRELKTGPASTELKRTHLVGQEEYKTSLQLRLMKIGARLRNPSFPDEVIEAAVTDADRATLLQEATDFLRKSGQTAILDNSEYEPIPSRLLDTFVRELARILERVRASKIHWRLLGVSSSFLPHDRLVIWDFFSPGENDTTALSRL